MAVNNVRQIVEIDIILDIILKASVFTNLKLRHVSDTFLQRTVHTRYKNLLCGDIARLGVKHYLEILGFSVSDWDEVRTDNFRGTRKEYDLKVNDTMIEVASSQMQQTDLRWVLANEHIIQPIRVHRRDIVIQVFYTAEPFRLYLFGWTESDLLADDAYKEIRNVGGYRRDFWMMPFSDINAFPASRLRARL